MKRRAFLTLLGLAPVVAQALPRPANPVTLAKGGPVTPTKYIVGETGGEAIMPPTSLALNQGTIIAGSLRSKNNKFVVDLSGGRITIHD